MYMYLCVCVCVCVCVYTPHLPLKEGMTTHSSILAWRIPKDKGAWWATVHGVTKSQPRPRTAADHSFFIRPSVWTFRLLPCLGRGKQCCSEHCGACIFGGHVFLWIYAQEWDCRVIW